MIMQTVLNVIESYNKILGKDILRLYFWKRLKDGKMNFKFRLYYEDYSILTLSHVIPIDLLIDDDEKFLFKDFLNMLIEFGTESVGETLQEKIDNIIKTQKIN